MFVVRLHSSVGLSDSLPVKLMLYVVVIACTSVIYCRKRLMDTCLVPDFGFMDIVSPGKNATVRYTLMGMTVKCVVMQV